jgi:sensor histidine kinase YesM
MEADTMKSRFVILSFLLLLALLLCSLFMTVPSSLAGDRALEQLLEVFQKKGLLSADEVEMIRQTMEQDIEKMTQREKEIEAKKKALNQRENSLQEKEDALATCDGQRKTASACIRRGIHRCQVPGCR